MFERFTERARQVVALAQEEARTLRHAHIGTEHLLLGLLREQEGVGAHALESFDITLERARGEVVRIVGVGEHAGPGQTHIPFTPRAKQILERATQEARSLGHNYIGTEHILLGLLSLGDGTSRRILLDCHAEPDQIRSEVMRMLSGPEPPAHSADGEGPRGSGQGFEEWIRVGPGAAVRRLLMVAAARALDDGRSGIEARDVLLALTRDEKMGPVLAELGVDEAAVSRAVERRRQAASPP